MKKNLFLMPLAAVLLLGGCFNKGETVVGTYEYENTRGSVVGDYYSATVTVTVKDGKITAISLSPDTTLKFNLSAINETYGWTQEDIDNWQNGKQAFLDSFVGMSVEDVNSIVVSIDQDTENTVLDGQPTGISGIDAIAGATQSSGRVIKAIQNALSKLA